MIGSAITTNQSAREFSPAILRFLFVGFLAVPLMRGEYLIDSKLSHAHHASVLALTLSPLLTQSEWLAVRPATRRANTSDPSFRHRLASDRSAVLLVSKFPSDRSRCTTARNARRTIWSEPEAVAKVRDCDSTRHEFLEVDPLAIEIDRRRVDYPG